MNFKKTLFSAAILAGLLAGAQAVSLGPTGYTNDFSSQPGVADWTTLSIGTDHQYTSEALMDAAVEALAASSINTALTGVAADPPGTATLAVWSSTAFYLQTRPTQNGATLLMLALTNNTGNSALSLTVGYNLSINPAPGTEVVPGHVVYYSLSGAASTWNIVPGISADGTAGNKSFTLDLSGTPWANGASLYIIWADNDTAANPDAGYHIDNFSAIASGPVGPTPVAITTQPTPQVAVTNAPATFTVVASGTSPSYFWFKSPSSFLSASGPSYTIASVQPSDAGTYFVIVSNSLNSVTSTVVSLTVTQQVGWVAFNNQSTPTAPANVTTYSPAAVLAGPLTNVLFGNELPAYVTITPNAGAVVTATGMGTPPVGTPADTIFSAHVNWVTGSAGLQLRTTGLVTYVFSGLDTSKTYKFAGTAVRGGGTGGDYSNRWTKVELQGATSYVTNHTAGVVTSNQYPAYLTGNQVAFNAGMNNTNLAGANTGDVVEWVSIVPSAGAGSAPTNGTFTIEVSQYTNATPYMPAGITPVPPYSYCLGEIRLEQSAPSGPGQPTVHIVRNADGTLTLSWPDTASCRILATNDLSAALHTWPQLPSIISSNVVGSTVNVTVSGAGTHKFFEVVTP